MTNEDKFKIEQTLEMIEQKLVDDSNSCEFQFLLDLKEKLIKKLEGKTWARI